MSTQSSPQRLRNSQQQQLGGSGADLNGRSDGSPERPRFTRANSLSFNPRQNAPATTEATYNTPLSERPQATHSQSYSIHPPMMYQYSSQQHETSVTLGHPRQTTRPSHPQFSSPNDDTTLMRTHESYEMTAELLAEIERADYEQFLQKQQQQQQYYTTPAPGTEGLAYAGGVVSSGGSSNISNTLERGSPREIEGPSASGHGSMARRQVHRRSRSRTPELQHSPLVQTSITTHTEFQSRTRSSPLYQALTTAQAQAQTQTQGQAHPSPTMHSATDTNAKVRTPDRERDRDRSLPVREEPEEDHDKDTQQNRNSHVDERGKPRDQDSATHTPPLTIFESDLRQEDNRERGGGIQAAPVEDRRREQDEEVEDISGDGSHTPRSPPYLPPIQTTSLQETIRASQSNTSQASNFDFDPNMVEQVVRKLQGQTNNHGPASQASMQSIQQRLQEHQLYGKAEENQPSEGSNTRRDSSKIQGPSQQRPDSVDAFFDAQAYLEHYLYSPQGTPAPSASARNSIPPQLRVRPDAPIPPTPHSQTAAPSPLPNPPLRSLIPIQSPAPPGGTPYPYPFSHLRRGYAPAANATNSPFPSQQGTLYDENAHPPQYDYHNLYDPVAVQHQLALQMQMYALNNGAISDSTFSAFSPAASPFPGAKNPYVPYNAFQAFLEQSQHRAAQFFNQTNGRDDAETERGLISASIRSSPSHLPVDLQPVPAFRGRGLKKSRLSDVRTARAGIRGARPKPPPPPRVESTQPRETSPEPSTSGEETAGENGDLYNTTLAAPGSDWVHDVGGTTVDDDSEWVDEDVDEEDLLDLEFHPSYVLNVNRRRKRWEQRWGELVRAVQALDRQTDSTVMVLASPSHSSSLHSLSSRSLRRDPSLQHSPAISSIRNSFAQIAGQRRAARSKSISLIDRLSSHSFGSANGSPTSTDSREEDLRRALGAALGSLSELGRMYEDREQRWREEMSKLAEERESVDVLLRQALGSNIPNNTIGRAL